MMNHLDPSALIVINTEAGEKENDVEPREKREKCKRIGLSYVDCPWRSKNVIIFGEKCADLLDNQQSS